MRVFFARVGAKGKRGLGEKKGSVSRQRQKGNGSYSWVKGRGEGGNVQSAEE